MVREYPYPPESLATRVFRLDPWMDPYRAYEAVGRQTRDAVVGLLPEGWSFEGKRVLDFGSGAGRTLRHFIPDAEAGEFWGADMDAPSIKWMHENLCPPLHAWRCGIVPPLGLEHGSFDLIYAISVFTHLTDASSRWLLEMHRLLKPGGILIATYVGRWYSEFLAGEPWNEDLVGFNTLHHRHDWELGGPTALISDWWLREHWGRAFEIVEIAPQIHDHSYAVLRKRDVELTSDDIERPSDDPREYASVRHNLRQLRHAHDKEIERIRAETGLQLGSLGGEIEATRRAGEAQAEAIRRFYEESSSWRATAPLRALAQLGRSMRPG